MTDLNELRISPSIHEGVIERHFAVDPISREAVDDSVISGMTDAVQNLRHGLAKAHNVAKAVLANEMQTIAARHKQIEIEAGRITGPAISNFDKVRARALKEIELVSEQIAAPPKPTDFAGHSLASEVRTRLAGMKPADRKKALDAALHDGDDIVLGAVLNGPAMLSGIATKEEMAVLRTRWQHLRHAPEVDRINRLKAALTDFDRAGQLALTFSLSLANRKIIEQAEAKERAVKDAITSAA
ncbi:MULTISPECIES: hypothetical protein [unclassified Phyllobacterium]|uniref:hypothetical protein n=1 Tax=unclassified Phyllobacterium TaxID=2638441 RepID=UPI0030131DB3